MCPAYLHFQDWRRRAWRLFSLWIRLSRASAVYERAEEDSWCSSKFYYFVFSNCCGDVTFKATVFGKFKGGIFGIFLTYCLICESSVLQRFQVGNCNDHVSGSLFVGDAVGDRQNRDFVVVSVSLYDSLSRSIRQISLLFANYTGNWEMCWGAEEPVQILWTDDRRKSVHGPLVYWLPLNLIGTWAASTLYVYTTSVFCVFG